MTITPKRHVFISYAWNDGATVARWLYDRFNREPGWSAWMDRDLHADTLFSHALQTRIDEADLLVCVVSPEVNRKHPPSFVQLELRYATQEGVDKPVFAALAKAGCPLPLLICGNTYVRFIDEAAYESAFADLTAKISQSMARAGSPPDAAPESDAVAVSEDSSGQRRARELAYLSGLARRYSPFGKLYVAPAARAEVPAAPDPSSAPADPLDPADAEVLDFLAEIQAAVYGEQRHTPDDAGAPATTAETYDALTEALAKFERVAIVGDPGAGKSTTLKRFAHDLAEAARDDDSAPLPVFVPLGGYDGGGLDALRAYIEAQFGGLALDDYLPEAGLPRAGKTVVVLLDGLNETAHAHVPDVQAWLDAHPTTRVMLTCRKLDYHERRLNLQRVDVLPLDLLRIDAFMAAYRLNPEAREALYWGLAGPEFPDLWRAWRAANLDLREFWYGERKLTSGHPAHSKTSSAQDALYNATRARLRADPDAYPGLLGLARNPFLLSITIAIYLKERAAPRNRADLFAKFVAQLFAERGRPAAIQRPPWIDETVQRAALARLAYAMTAEGKGTQADLDWARGVVASAAPGHDPDHLIYLAASAGLVETSGPPEARELRFTHQLLGEYFAAFEMAEDLRRGVGAAKYWPLDRARWWEATGWEETALLLAGMDGDASAVVRWLTPVQPVLAWRCATESGAPCDESALAGLYEPSDEALKAGRISTAARAAWGRVLAKRGDTRPGVGVIHPTPGPSPQAERGEGVPDVAWCDVPDGEYIIGGDPEAFQPLSETRVNLGYAFKIARYPVTYAQFGAFLDDPDGFANPQWWRELHEEGRGGEMREQYFKYPNHPRENVSWYQAMAYSHWLNARLKGTTVGTWVIGETAAIRLPTEYEWEIAARGAERYIFPWGNEYVPGYANIHETYGDAGPHYLQMTSAVGLYPQGASSCGALDMAGNVWEWCLNPFDMPESREINSNSRRALRGGSWGNIHHLARAASRDRLVPDNRLSLRGFRLVCVPINQL